MNGGMPTRSKQGRTGATKPDVEEASRQPSAYMLGLSEQVASMADAVLIVQGMELPIHTYILIANSPVFADMLETASTTLRIRSHSIKYLWKETACQSCAQP